MPLDAIAEARRQIEICNACRYCEGYCAVFPAITIKRDFSDGDVVQLANLCHNCRGCYYACQYTEPHEFALNLPAALAEARTESWERFAAPAAVGRLFQRHGVALAGLLALTIAALFWAGREGATFYAVMSHDLMVAIFAPAFLAPLVLLGLGLRRYWRAVEGGRLTWARVWGGLRAAGAMRNLKGGHGEGCNFEDEDRFSPARRQAHQALMWGFLLCFASTSAATIMHYGLGWPAPYPLFSLPKLLGVSGGVLMTVGGAWLAVLKLKADRALGDRRVWGGEMALVLLLLFVAVSGLALYGATGTQLVSPLLALHLGAVMALFLTIPYSKMAHGAYRLAALIVDQGRGGG